MFNTKKRILVFYGLTFLILFICSLAWAICVAKMEPDITVLYLFHKHIILNLLFCLFYYFCRELGFIALIIVVAVSIFCLLFPIIYSIKRRKVFPYNLIYIFFLSFYFFISADFFIFGGDFIENASKDYSKAGEYEFIVHDEGRTNDFSFTDSDANTIHIVSYKKNILTDDDKIALVNGQRIINAIEKFYSENNFYPDTLEQLVPEYLEKIPETEFSGIFEGREFHYDKDDSNRWYNLKFFGFFTKFYWHNARRFWEYDED
ncbi:MAG: hypothetical protein IJU95_00810 [Treponema sp.]|nr:hypothetical protein [Treponema sp.]